MADRLSRRGKAPGDEEEDDDVYMFFDARMYAVTAELMVGDLVRRVWLVEGI